ncbi:putative O-methylsterigmatocystin oxidoreductase [Clohesyomyces aquaticus]|uniref:Putative O-methylsterigmatocystin oxidoreductase n=1 Tax=Clohesyomyces aquaticus TaxID=1231657 RepID=A0A1Y1Z610_9PLEO|nr:putative O-methylsterigmatocystin oxidoreductase [Clohesyomyces aquaticus]
MVLYLLPILLLSALIFYYTQRSTKRPPKGLISAPGPKGLPLLGNTHQLSNHPHRQIQAWARQFGEVYKIRLGWNDWYMLCSPSSVRDIIDRQSVNSSSRAPMPVANEALSGGMRFLFMEYGEKWRRLRGISHRWLTPKASATFMPSQEFEGKMLVEEVLRGAEEKAKEGGRGNEKAYQAVRRYTVSVIMTSTYGKRIPEWECEEVREIYGIMNDFSRVAAPGAYLADTIPPLGRLLPKQLQWWRPSLKPLFDRQAKLWMSLWSGLKTQMETGHAPECFVKQVISSDYASHGVSELQAAFLAGSLIEAGSETTSAGINTALLYLSAHPSVLQKAYNELRTVVPASRSPTFADEEKLPYVRAIVKETMRIRPVTNIGTPHYTTAPIIYKNIFIPSGSIVAIQQYAIHYLPSLFPDPETFNPDRYLAFPEKAGFYAAGGAEQRDHWSFGGGRRVCSGLHLAENSMFIVLAKLIWAFDIGPPVDELGREVGVDLSDEAFEAGGNTVPKPFRARYVVRSEEVRRTILREAEEARRDGYVLRGEKVTEEGVES